MAKKIVCVFQDCVMCGDKGKKLQQIILDKKIDFKLVSFASEEGKELIYHAITEHNIKTMPFFTDGEKFSTSIEDFGKTCEKTEKVLEKREKTVKKNRKSVKKGAKK